MEFEQLEVGRRCILGAITSQDVGDYYSILHQDVVLVSHFRYPPMPLTVADTIPLLARAHRRAASFKAASRSKGKTPGKPGGKPTEKPTEKPVGKSPLPPVPCAAAAESTRKAISAVPPDDLDSLPYAERVDVVKGRLLVTERLYCILNWLNHGRYIAETSVDLEARKVILQESDVLPAAPTPTSDAERYAAMGRQHTDRNQRLSRLLVRWGHEDLLFLDECYFEDGLIVTVQRRMIPPREILAINGIVESHHPQAHVQRRLDAMTAARKSFYAARASRVDAFDHATLPLLDFTFCAASDPLQLLRARPVSGLKHVPRTVEPIADVQLSQGVFLNQQSDPSRPQKDQRVIVKARNKQGDEEVYEFIKNTSRYGFMHSGATRPVNSFESLADKVECAYAATSVRISGCGMESTDLLVPVLRRLVVNAIMTLHSLDLSDNHISVLPDFSLLPLQRLHLHKNNISDWGQIEEFVCPLPLLQSVSLHGNPIAENDPHYWPAALARIMRHPNRVVQLRQLDLVTLTAQDYYMASTHEMFKTGNTKLLEATKKRIAKGTKEFCR